RRPLAGGALAVAAPGDGPGFLDRDDQLQGNPGLRRPRARLQRDLRLAHEWRCAAGEPAPARAGSRHAQEVHVSAGGTAEGLTRLPFSLREKEKESGIIPPWTSTSSAAPCATGCWACRPATTTTSSSAKRPMQCSPPASNRSAATSPYSCTRKRTRN